MSKEFDKLVKAIKGQLKKDNPNLDNDKLESKAFAIATAQWKKKHGSAPSSESISQENIKTTEKKIDEKGRIIVAENVKLLLEGTIASIQE